MLSPPRNIDEARIRTLCDYFTNFLQQYLTGLSMQILTEIIIQACLTTPNMPEVNVSASCESIRGKFLRGLWNLLLKHSYPKITNKPEMIIHCYNNTTYHLKLKGHH